jgi:hypothetical protein
MKGVLSGFPYTSVAVKPRTRVGRSQNLFLTFVFIDLF